MSFIGDVAPTLRWTEVFPWIARAARATERALEGAQPWWLDRVDGLPAEVQDTHIAALADMALQHMGKWSLGELFPLVRHSVKLESLSFTARARNALSRRGSVAVGDIQGMLLMDLLNLPNVGVGTVDSMLRVLAEASIDQSASPASAEHDAPLIEQERTDAQPRPSLRIDSFADDLQTLAFWYTALGIPDQPLLDDPLPPGSPERVVDGKNRLRSLTAADVLPKVEVDLSIAGLLETELRQFEDSRYHTLLATRFFAESPQTLDEVARPMGVTRERVRQLESKARARLVHALEDDSLLGTVGASVREMVGTLLPLGELLKLVPALSKNVDSIGQPAWRVLDRIDDAYEIEDGWCAAPSIRAVKTSTQTAVLEQANQHGVAALRDLDQLTTGQPVSVAPEILEEWLRYCGYEVIDHWVYTRIGSLGDWTAAVLSITGSPLSSEEIRERLPVPRSLASLKNALATDERFERVDRDRWALAEWGLESYSGIKGLIRQELARSGGEVAVNTLIEQITGRYSVSASSVMAYASAPPFESQGGVVRFTTGDRNTRKTLYRTRCLYRHGDSLLYRTTVSGEHLRGSGSVAPVALATALGLQHGESWQLSSPLGPQSLGWTGLQPAFGTIRRFLTDRDIAIGQEIFLKVGSNHSFDIEPVPYKADDPLSRALNLVGCADTDPADARAAMARAITLPESSPAVSVIGGYRERGDHDVADLLAEALDQLESVPHRQEQRQAPDINDILDLL
jgi:Sigma-70, region 4/Bacterial RNA polymerase, alpha chain C terminal domain